MASTLPLLSFPYHRSLPREASRHLLQRSSNIIILRRRIVSASIPSKDPPSVPHDHSRHLASPSLPPVAYHVHRTASQLLPIYHLAKRGGNLHQTRIRKVQGDVDVLKDELQLALSLKPESLAINRVTGHIIIKGWFKDEVIKFLEAKHF